MAAQTAIINMMGANHFTNLPMMGAYPPGTHPQMVMPMA